MGAPSQHSGATATETVAHADGRATLGLTIVHHPREEHLGQGMLMPPAERIVLGHARDPIDPARRVPLDGAFDDRQRAPGQARNLSVPRSGTDLFLEE